MHKLVGVAIALAGLASSAGTRPREDVVMLRVESMSSRPVAFTAWMSGPRRTGGSPAIDSLTATTPASIPVDSATREIRVLTQRAAAVRVRVLEDSLELQRPANAWGRDLRLRRAADHFEVLFDMRLIEPR